MTLLLEYEDLGLVKPGIFLHMVKGEQVGAGTPGPEAELWRSSLGLLLQLLEDLRDETIWSAPFVPLQI